MCGVSSAVLACDFRKVISRLPPWVIFQWSIGTALRTHLKIYVRHLSTELHDDPQNLEVLHTERGVGYIFQARAKSASDLD